MNKKEYYAELISKSPLFTLDKEKNPSAYRSESYKMVGYLFCYLMAINPGKYEEYGLEISETAMRCFDDYKSEEGTFLTYFCSAIKKECLRTNAKNIAQQMRGGIHISEDDERNLKSIRKYLDRKGIDKPSREQLQTISDVVKLPIKKVISLLEMNETINVVSVYTTNDDGEEVNILDTVAAEEDTNMDGQIEEVYSHLNKIEEQYLQLQDRTKPIISAMLTARICEIIVQYDIETNKYSFINRKIVEEFVKNEKCPTQREIADLFGKNEASISRTVKEFLVKIK